jgi:hypothetical protein
MDPPGARVLVRVAVGTPAGGLVLARLDSPWSLVCAFGFFLAVMLLALSAGVGHHW